MVSGLHEAGYKFLIYVNPFIVDPSSVTAEDGPARFAPRFDAMEDMGLLLKNQDGETFIDFAVPNIPQRDAHPDFSNSGTVEFIPSRSKASCAPTTWMAGWRTSASGSPDHSVPEDGSDSIERRNTFPVDWQRATREAMEDVRGDDWVMFARSGFTKRSGCGPDPLGGRSADQLG